MQYILIQMKIIVIINMNADIDTDAAEGVIRAVYTRENRPRLTLATAYIIRERNYFCTSINSQVRISCGLRKL